MMRNKLITAKFGFASLVFLLLHNASYAMPGMHKSGYDLSQSGHTYQKAWANQSIHLPQK